jgi:hypothetical protein
MAKAKAKEKPAPVPEAKPEEAPAAQPAAQPAAKPAPAEGGQPSGGSSAPFILSLIGGILMIISSSMVLAVGLSGAIVGAVPGAEAVLAMLGALSSIPIAFSVLVIIGALLMKKPAKARIGAILVLVFSILSLITIIGSGFIIGSILGIIGGALGLKK